MDILVQVRLDNMLRAITAKAEEVASLPEDPSYDTRLAAALLRPGPKRIARRELSDLLEEYDCLKAARGIDVGDGVYFEEFDYIFAYGIVSDIEYNDGDALLHLDVREICNCGNRCCQGWYQRNVSVNASLVTEVVTGKI